MRWMSVSNTPNEVIRLSGIIHESIVDGPGLRFVIFTQGCHKRCEGCHNPSTHDLMGGYLKSMDEIVDMWQKNPLLKGITISGGEPFIQAKQSLYLATRAKQNGLDVLVYSGYYYEELKRSKNVFVHQLLETADYLIDGPFECKLKDLNLLFRGSKNQRIICLNETIKQNQVILYEPKAWI